MAYLHLMEAQPATTTERIHQILGNAHAHAHHGVEASWWMVDLVMRNRVPPARIALRCLLNPAQTSVTAPPPRLDVTVRSQISGHPLHKPSYALELLPIYPFLALYA